MSDHHPGTRDGDGVDDTFNRAVAVIESVDFRVKVEKKMQRLEFLAASFRTWLVVVAILLALNYAHDLGATTEMFDWWDGRDGGLLSSETEHEITVMTPLLLAALPLIYGFVRDRKAKTRALADADE